ncbi:MAG: hypothetical protein HY717_08765 [Planctomycetes bacterium]|nr:hypothetical protein [Planctomycetota bacterium]
MAMIEFHKIWIEQCDATEGLREDFGEEKAIRYLIGEKFLNFIKASDSRPEFSQELPKFAARVKEIFEPHEIAEFLDKLLQEGAADPAEEWVFDDFEDAELEQRDMVSEAEKIVRIERAKELLLQ